MADKILDIKMYDFLIRSIRTADELEGHLFLKNFLEGSQTVWETIQNKIFSLKTLWSITDCPDAYLTYLKRIVGWTIDIEKIISGLDNAALRRLISISIPLWKSRTTEQAIIDILNVLLAGKSRVWNWFDLRWVLDETIFAEEHQGRDPWLLSFPDGNEEYWSNVRIVDPGSDNRKLLKDILNLMRPVSERYEIIYLKFLDLFDIEDDWSQWDIITGKAPNVSNGLIILENDYTNYAQGVGANVTNSGSWSNYIASSRMRGKASSANDGYGLMFYLNSVNLTSYLTWISVADNKLYLGRWTSAGGKTVDASFDFNTVGYVLKNNVWYGLRVQISPEGVTNRIKVYFDGVERINTTESTYTQGSAGPYRDQDIKADCSEIEILGLPVEKDTVEINY